MTLSITYTQITVPDYLKKFAGRKGIGYDEFYSPLKPYKIAEANRDFVWLDIPGLSEQFIRDILHKNPLPSIIVCNNEIIDSGNRSTVLWLFVNGLFNVEEIGKIEDVKRNEELYSNWCGCTMPITIIENATEDQKAAYYENFNKGVSLTFGQKLKNRKQRELVSNALKMIGRNGPFELKELIDRVWSNQFKQTKNLRELELAFMILVSTMMGSGHFHTNYAQHSQTIMNDDIVTNWTNFRKILEMLDGVDNSRSVDKKKKRECFKKFIGAIIYDFWRMDNDELNSKWQEFFRLAYTELSSKDIKLILDVGTRRGNNISRIQGISINVTEFLQNNRTLVVVPGEPTENNVDENETEEDDTDED